MTRRDYRFLDDEEDRLQFIARMREVRESFIAMRSIVPEARWYEARHDGWSLAAILGHLQWMDRLHLLQVQLAIWNLPFPFSARTWERVSGWQQRLFRRRLTKSSVDGIRAALPDQEAFILQLAVDDFSKRLTYAPTGQTLTVEQAVQEFLYFFWLDRLRALRIAEGLHPTPGDLSRQG